MQVTYNITAEQMTRSALSSHLYLIAGYIGALLATYVLLTFSHHSDIQERLLVTLAFLGLTIVYWLIAFFSRKDDVLKLNVRSPTLYSITPVLVGLMLLTNTVISLSGTVAPYSALSPELILKGAFLLGVSIILPGLLLFAVMYQHEVKSSIRFVVALHLSMAVVGLTAFCLYYFRADMALMSPLIMVFIMGLWLIQLFRRSSYGGNRLSLKNVISFMKYSISITRPLTIDKWTISLGLMITTSCMIGFLVHSSQMYMIAGDAWVSLKPGADALSGIDMEQTRLEISYPIAYGFIFAGLSQISGIPMLNANVLLFPLISLNLVTFYILLRTVFGMARSVATTGSLLYGFTGGFGWLAGYLMNTKLDFWSLSYKTQDMYFSAYLWNNIQFYHKPLALTFAFSAIIVFYLAITRKEQPNRLPLLVIASLFTIFSFYIHMLEALFVLPVIIYLLCSRSEHRVSLLLTFVAITSIIIAITELFTGGYYSKLFLVKITNALSEISILKGHFLVGSFAATSLPFLFFNIRNERTLISNKFFRNQNFEFRLLGVFLLGVYIYGIVVWSNAPQQQGLVYLANQLPWYFIPMRFGFIGLLAIFSLFFITGRERWAGLSLTWFISIFAVANIWWGSRILDYIFPVLAFAAAYALHQLRDHSFKIKLHENSNSFRIVKPVLAIVLGATIILSSSSFVHGFSQYSGKPSMDDNLANVALWIFRNVPTNQTVVVPEEDYIVKTAISSFGGRNTTSFTELNEKLTGINDVRFLQERGLTYFVSKNHQIPKSIEDKVFTVYRSGELAVYALLEPSGTNSVKLSNIGFGNAKIINQHNANVFIKTWQMSWAEKIGLSLEFDQKLPKDSIVNVNLKLNQSEWGTPSAVQELYIRFVGTNSSFRTDDLLSKIKPESFSEFQFNVNDIEVERIEIVMMNGGTNSGTLTIDRLSYITPDHRVMITESSAKA